MDTVVSTAIRELERFIETVDDAMALPREAGAFSHALILATGASRGLEIGTSYGYSGLWIASALAENGGSLTSIDCDPRKSESARNAFDRAGLSKRVQLMTGQALDLLPGLGGPFDFVLSDADKVNCIRYVEAISDKLGDRAVILTDNTISHAEELAEFVAWIRRRDDFHSTGIPIGNGMELSIKRSSRNSDD